MNEIQFESRQDVKFLDRLASLPEGAELFSCIQCGTCGGTCPVAPALEHTPRRIFAMVRAGMKEQVLRSSTPWVCASCYKCTVSCPAKIKITEIMYALRREGLERGILPDDSRARRFATLFTDLVKKYGRGYELGLMLRFMLLRDPIGLLKQAPVGLRMLRTGRLPLLPHRIEDLEGFGAMVRRAVALDEEEMR